jgi:FkbM family methyltransferase
MVDLGANFGEISLYMSRYCPKAKILAIEASSYNFGILTSNCRFQSFPTGNIMLVNEAISDAKGMVEIEKGISAENIMVHKNIHRKREDFDKPEVQTEKIASDTLVSFLKRFGFAELDFLKVDIEGSEPLLYDSLKQCLSVVTSILIEIGDKADHRLYIPLITLLWDSGMECYDHASEKKFASLSRVTEEVLSVPVMDLWFVKPARAGRKGP